VGFLSYFLPEKPIQEEGQPKASNIDASVAIYFLGLWDEVYFLP